ETSADSASDLFLSLTIFFFSSRRRHTRSKRDWSSDVCSSDLGILVRHITGLSAAGGFTGATVGRISRCDGGVRTGLRALVVPRRSEERRVGKGRRSRGSGCQERRSGRVA